MGSPDVSTSERWDLRLRATIAILCGALFFEAMRPALAILIAVALAGVVALYALLRLPAVRANADVVRAEA